MQPVKQDIHLRALFVAYAVVTGDLAALERDNPSPEEIEQVYARLRATDAGRLRRDISVLPDNGISWASLFSFLFYPNPFPENRAETVRELFFTEPAQIPDPQISQPENDEEFEVCVLGAGFSGILAAIRLKESGIPFFVLEKNAGLGGVWENNRYPGCACDTEGELYRFSFERAAWKHYYPEREELQAYLAECVRKYGLEKQLMFGCRLESAVWDAEKSRWELTIIRSDGQILQKRVSFVISAVGQLGIPNMPAVQGLEAYDGPKFHSARWDENVSYDGKNVLLLGSAASAVQILPKIADRAARVFVAQRTPNWVFPPQVAPDAVLSERQDWLSRQVPVYGQLYRATVFYDLYGNFEGFFETGTPGADGLRDWFRKYLTDYIESRLDEEHKHLLPKLLPDYPPFARRGLLDPGWYAALCRKNVTLLDTRSLTVSAGNKLEVDGTEHRVDLAVYCTGFKALGLPYTVRGIDGVNLADYWGGADYDPRAYLGISVPRFPNFFFLFGPNTHPGAGSIPVQSEMQMVYILQAIDHVRRTRCRSLVCKEPVYRSYNNEVDERLSTLVWNVENATGWYKVGPGQRVATNLPFSIFGYWERIKSFGEGDYDFF